MNVFWKTGFGGCVSTVVDFNLGTTFATGPNVHVGVHLFCEFLAQTAANFVVSPLDCDVVKSGH